MDSCGPLFWCLVIIELLWFGCAGIVFFGVGELSRISEGCDVEYIGMMVFGLRSG